MKSKEIIANLEAAPEKLTHEHRIQIETLAKEISFISIEKNLKNHNSPIIYSSLARTIAYMLVLQPSSEDTFITAGGIYNYALAFANDLHFSAFIENENPLAKEKIKVDYTANQGLYITPMDEENNLSSYTIHLTEFSAKQLLAQTPNEQQP